MSGQGSSSSVDTSRRSSRRTKVASDKAFENVVQTSAITDINAAKKSKRKQTDKPVKAPPKKTGKKQKGTEKGTQLIQASDVHANTDNNSEQSGKTVQELVEEACAKIIPNIVTQVLNHNPPANTENTGDITTVSDDEDSGSETDYDEEEDLRSNALASRKRAVSSTFNTVASLGPSQPADLLPALDAKVIKKIKKGEFIDLALCLPSFSPEARLPIVTPTINSDGDPAWKLDTSTGRGKIRDFSDWMVAWNAFSRCLSYYFPVLSRQIQFYQSEITNLSRLYTFSSILSYDKAFRTRVSNKEVLRWDYHDNELRSALLIPLPQRVVQASCFTEETNTSPFRAPQRSSPGNPPSQPPLPPRSATIPPRNKPVCHFWNSVKGCSFRNCRFEHRCEWCQAREHNILFCPRRNEQN